MMPWIPGGNEIAGVGRKERMVVTSIYAFQVQ
jgi:hypothetical protein